MGDDVNSNAAAGANAFDQRVSDMKEAIKEGRWNQISSEVWGDRDAQRALSQAAREGQKEGLPAVEFRAEGGDIVVEFTKPGITGWISDKLAGKKQIKFSK